MLFNSYEFLLFIPVVFLLYCFVLQKNLKAQKDFILCVSYVFYGWWNCRFLGLIAFSSLMDNISLPNKPNSVFVKWIVASQ